MGTVKKVKTVKEVGTVKKMGTVMEVVAFGRFALLSPTRKMADS